MGDYGKKGPFTNPIKENYILEKFYEENFLKKDAQFLENFKVSKVNLAKNDVVENLDSASVDDYVNEVLKKKRDVVSQETIVLSKAQECLNLVFYCSTNYFDIENPQKGICSGKNEEILSNLSQVNVNGKTAVVFAGDLLGKEWQLKYLKNARIENNKALYFGLNKRKYRLMRDIKKFFTIGEKLGLDLDLYLMRGYDENFIIKELNRDILEEVYTELKDRYTKQKECRLHYLDGGSSFALNVVKKNKNKQSYYATIGLQTNMNNKSLTARGEDGASKKNRPLPTDCVFVCNGNYCGKLDDSTYHVSGQSQYLRTSKNNTQMLAPKGYNVFTVYLENDNELTIQEGGYNIYPESLSLEKEIYKENKKTDCLFKICTTEFNKKMEEMKSLIKKG